MMAMTMIVVIDARICFSVFFSEEEGEGGGGLIVKKMHHIFCCCLFVCRNANDLLFNGERQRGPRKGEGGGGGGEGGLPMSVRKPHPRIYRLNL